MKALLLSIIVFLAFLCALTLAAQVYGFENGYAPTLGPTLSRNTFFAVYSPLAYLRWLWRWGPGYGYTFYFSGVAGLGLFLVVLLKLYSLLTRLPGSPLTSQSETPQARWASWWSLRRLHLFRHAGVRLGAWHGKIVRALLTSHLFILSVTQGGKTSGLVIPTLLDGTETVSVIVYDPKKPGEIMEATAGYRSRFSKVVVFQPLEPDSDQYNPLDAVRVGTDYFIRDVQMITGFLSDPDGTENRQAQQDRHFLPLAREFHAGVIVHALLTWPGCSFADLYELVCGSLGIENLVKEMRKATHGGGVCHPVVWHACDIIEQTKDRELSALLNTIQRMLALWADPLVCRATARSDFSLTDLREGVRPLSLYLSFPFADQDRLRPLTSIILRQCLEYAAHKKGPWQYPLLAVLDEFQALGRLQILRLGLNYMLGMGVTMMLITPSMNEVEDIWGMKHPFLEGTGTKVAFGLRQARIASYFTDDIGKHTVRHERVSTDTNGHRTTTVENREEPLFSAAALMDLDDDQVYARIGNKNVILDKTFYFDDPVLLARSKMVRRP